MEMLSTKLVPCEHFTYNCDNYYGASVEQQLRDYDRKRWAHRDVERILDRRRRPRREDDDAPPKQRKVALVGSRSVGKSSLTVRYVDGHFVESYYPTIENTFSKVIRYKGQDFATEIIDTAGQSDIDNMLKDEYSILNSKHFIGIHGYMIVYSVASKQSFEMVRIIREKILNHLGQETVPMVIVGNKSDVRPEQRQVSKEVGQKLAAEFKCAWVETSARYDENVGKAFDAVIAEIEQSQNPNEPAGGNKCAVM